LSATRDLVYAATEAAKKLAEKGLPVSAVELASTAGRSSQELSEQENRWVQIAAYHERRAKDCEGLARKFHQDAAEALRNALL